jgi:hypothetical protein
MLDNQEEICSRIEESVWQIPDHILHWLHRYFLFCAEDEHFQKSKQELLEKSKALEMKLAAFKKFLHDNEKSALVP